MRTLFTILSFTLCGCLFAETPRRDEIVNLFEHDGIYHIGGWAVGAAGAPDQFFLLAQAISKEGKEEDFRLMLEDSNPAVRAMGLVCLAKQNIDFPIMKDDNSEVLVFPAGCIGDAMTIESFSRKLKRSGYFRKCFTKEITKQ